MFDLLKYIWLTKCHVGCPWDIGNNPDILLQKMLHMYTITCFLTKKRKESILPVQVLPQIRITRSRNIRISHDLFDIFDIHESWTYLHVTQINIYLKKHMYCNKEFAVALQKQRIRSYFTKKTKTKNTQLSWTLV